MRDRDFFHSGDPVEAAGFVLSDAAALLWESTRDRLGFAAFADQAAPQLIRWESRHGWTRSGCGKTSQKETSLAHVLASMLRTPDMWTSFAERYLAAIDRLAGAQRGPALGRGHDACSGPGSARVRDLAEWHQTLCDRLAGGLEGKLLDRLLTNPALSGPEQAHLRSGLARQHGHTEGS